MIKIGSRGVASLRCVIFWWGHRPTKLIATIYIFSVSNALSKAFQVYFRTGVRCIPMFWTCHPSMDLSLASPDLFLPFDRSETNSI